MTAAETTLLDRIADLPDEMWRQCGDCGAMIHRDRLRAKLWTCPECATCFRLTARQRITTLVDPGSFVDVVVDLASGDPLGFTDVMPYPKRVVKAQEQTGETEAVVLGRAELGGRPLVLAVLDFGFLGGSMSSGVGERIARGAELAVDIGAPFVVISSSGGARMQEGMLSLLQMASTAAAIQQMRDAGVPYVSVLTDPVYGGVMASFATLGDVIIAESGTRAGFAGPRVIAQTIRQELPTGFQTDRFLFEHGHIDMVVSRAELRGVLGRLLALFAGSRGVDGVRVPPARRPVEPNGRDGWESVRLARQPGRPTARQYIGTMFTDFVELHGDRAMADDEAVIGGVAMLDQMPVVVVAHSKGVDTAQNVRQNFGMPHPSGYRKARRLFELAERLRMPVVTLIDTPGAYPGLLAEEENQSGAIAEAIAMASGLRTPVLSAVIGEGGSGGALALATGDRLLMQENTVFSVISPEGCAAILFGDAARAPEAANALKLRAADLVRLGIADEIVAEPEGGSVADPVAAAVLLRDALRRELRALVACPLDDLLRRRYRRLRSFGDVASATGREPADA